MAVHSKKPEATTAAMLHTAMLHAKLAHIAIDVSLKDTVITRACQEHVLAGNFDRFVDIISLRLGASEMSMKRVYDVVGDVPQAVDGQHTGVMKSLAALQEKIVMTTAMNLFKAASTSNSEVDVKDFLKALMVKQDDHSMLDSKLQEAVSEAAILAQAVLGQTHEIRAANQAISDKGHQFHRLFSILPCGQKLVAASAARLEQCCKDEQAAKDLDTCAANSAALPVIKLVLPQLQPTGKKKGSFNNRTAIAEVSSSIAKILASTSDDFKANDSNKEKIDGITSKLDYIVKHVRFQVDEGLVRLFKASLEAIIQALNDGSGEAMFAKAIMACDETLDLASSTAKDLDFLSAIGVDRATTFDNCGDQAKNTAASLRTGVNAIAAVLSLTPHYDDSTMTTTQTTIRIFGFIAHCQDNDDDEKTRRRQ